MPGLYYGGTYYDQFSLNDAATQDFVTLTGGIDVSVGDALVGYAVYGWNITNSGAIKATGNGSVGIYLRAGGAVTNGAGATISGAAAGVRIQTSTNGIGSKSGNVSNSGTISGGSAAIAISGNGTVTNSGPGAILRGTVQITGTGAVTNNGSIGGSVFLGGGDVQNGSGQSINASGVGVELGNAAAGTVGNYGTISAIGNGAVGAYLKAGGTVTNGVGDDIYGVATGVRIQTSTNGVGSAYGAVVNRGTIASGTELIGISGNGSVENGTAPASTYLLKGSIQVTGTGSVLNDGSIAGSVFLGGGEVDNGSGMSISGSGIGVETGNAAAGTVANSGTISAVGNGAVGVYIKAGGAVTNNTGDSIYGVATGIRIQTTNNGIGSATGSVLNLGTISSTTEGVAISGNGFVTNGTSVGQSVLLKGGIQITGTGTVANDGSIAGSVFLGCGSVENADGQSIKASGVGIETGNAAAGTVGNYGTVSATGNGAVGIYLKAGGTVTNGPGADTYGTATGIRIQVSNNGTGSANGNVINLGTIASGTEGVSIDGDGSVINGNGGGQSILLKGGIQITGTGSVINNGAITGSVFLGGGNVANGTGDMPGPSIIATGVGVEIGSDAPGTAVNFGTISATGNGAVGVYLRVTGKIINASGGTIAGTADGIRAQGSGTTIVDDGTISGGEAVQLTGGGNTLALGPDAVLSGSVQASGSGNVLELMSGATSGVLSGANGRFGNFGSVTVDNGGTWTVYTDTLGPGTQIDVGAGGSVLLKGTVSATVDLGGPATVSFDPGQQQTTLSGAQPGTTINLQNTSPGQVVLSGGVVTVTSGGMTTPVFQLSATEDKFLLSAVLTVSGGTSGSTDVEIKGATPEDKKELYKNLAEVLSRIDDALSVIEFFVKFEDPAQLGLSVLKFGFDKLLDLLAGENNVNQGAVAVVTLARDLEELIRNGGDNAPELALSLAGIAAKAGQVYLRNLAEYDPPDPNFTTVSTPPVLSLPLPTLLSTAPNAAQLGAFVGDIVQIISLSSALITAGERYSGAILAGDAKSAALQLAASAQFSSQLDTVLMGLGADFGSLAATLPAISDSDFTSATAQFSVAAVGDAAQPLPDDVLSTVMSATGLDAATVSSLVSEGLDDFTASGLQNDLAGESSALSQLGASIVSGGTVDGATVTVISGTENNGAVVGNGGNLTVGSGGTALGAIVSAGGLAVILGGGSVEGIVVVGGGIEVTLGNGRAAAVAGLGQEYVEAGGTVGFTTISAGGDQFVEIGGSANATLDEGGSEEIYGVAVATIIDNGGRIDLFAGGTTIGTVASNGVELVIGLASGTVDVPGGFDFVYGSAAATEVSGGAEYVELGAVAIGTTVASAGAQVVYGTADGTVLDSGGTAYFLAGSIASGTVVDNGLAVILQVASATTVAGGGFDFVEPGGTAFATVLNGGDEFIEPGGTAIGTIIGNGATQVDYGVAGATVINSGGFEDVYPGGTASGTIVDNGGVDNIFVGFAVGTVDNSGGKDFIYSGIASSTIVAAGGAEFVEFGGTAIGTLVSGAGATQDVVAGLALSTTLAGGGVQVVEAGETASNTTIGTGGYEFVAAGGTAAGATISGGIAELTAGAATLGLVAFAAGAGGLLKLDDSQHFFGMVAGFGIPDQIDLEDIAFASGTTTLTFEEAGNNQSGTLTVSDGTHTANLTLLGQYVAGQFHLAADGAGGTLVTDLPIAATAQDGTLMLVNTGR